MSAVAFTPLEGVDYSYSRPTAAQIKVGGKKFVVRYITDPGAGNKGLSGEELTELRLKGLEVVLVWELGVDAAVLGKARGIADATRAEANRVKLGLGKLPIYFAVDFDANEAELAQTDGYFEGVASVIGWRRTGVYGGFRTIAHLQGVGKVKWFWQTYAWSTNAHGGAIIASGLHLYQYDNGVKLGSGQVDLVRALQKEYGQHAPLITKPAVKPATHLVAGVYAFVRNRSTKAIYALGPAAETLHHLTPVDWAHWKALGYRYTDVEPAALEGWKVL
jgi:hypothetical protein